MILDIHHSCAFYVFYMRLCSLWVGLENIFYSLANTCNMYDDYLASNGCLVGNPYHHHHTLGQSWDTCGGPGTSFQPYHHPKQIRLS